MTRSLIQCGIADLERTFGDAPQDAKTLRALKQELGFRQVPRAVALLAKVNLAIKMLAPPGGSKSADTVVVPAISSDLTSAPTADLFEHSEQAPDAILVTRPEPVQASPVVPKPVNKSCDLTPQAAYALLQVSASSTWESIEEKRQSIVRRTSPEHSSALSAGQREQMMFEAERANAAYLVLLRERSNNIG